MKEVVESWAKRSIDCAEGSSKPVPFSLSKMWHVNVSVLQVGDEDQMIINNKVWDEVEADIGAKSKVIDGPSHDRDCDTETNVTDHNLPILLRFEKD